MFEDITSSVEESPSDDSLDLRGKKRKKIDELEEEDDLENDKYVYISDLLGDNQNEEHMNPAKPTIEKEIDELMGTGSTISSDEDPLSTSDKDDNENKDLIEDEKHFELLRVISTSLGHNAKKKPKIDEISSAREENEFNIGVAHLPSAKSNKEVTIDTLLRPLQVGDAVGRKNAQRLLKVLKSARSETTTPPLSDPEKRRLTRSAAFDLISQEVSEWVPTVQWLHRQQHLDFGKPLPFDLNKVHAKQDNIAPSNSSSMDTLSV
jgi:U3 small nucleolar RNA-associated protein 14